ncbi:MAG: PAS domain S-box protein [Planctomycetota bacterium]|nr:PAS domain S-box protein [Planctomycetota bacterium]
MRFEKRFVHKDGSFRWGDVRAILRRDEDGNRLYFLTTVVDMTDRKRAEITLRRSEEFQRAMISCSPIALYVIDLDGNVQSWNSSAERIFGYRPVDVIGKPIPIVSEDKKEQFDALRREALEKGGFHGRELVRTRKDGSHVHISLSVAPIRNAQGEMVGILGAAEDITQRKADEGRLEWNLRRNEVLSNIAAGLLTK